MKNFGSPISLCIRVGNTAGILDLGYELSRAGGGHGYIYTGLRSALQDRDKKKAGKRAIQKSVAMINN